MPNLSFASRVLRHEVACATGGKRAVIWLSCGHIVIRPACRALPRSVECGQCRRARYGPTNRSRAERGLPPGRSGRRKLPLNRLYSRQLRR